MSQFEELTPMQKFEDLSPAEKLFVHEKTRHHLVEWAASCILNDHIDENFIRHQWGSIYLDYALSKGWVTKREPRKLTAAGFKTAASVLKR